MQLEEIPESDRYPYKNKCTCGKKYILLSQEDDEPEYRTGVYIKCECGQYIEFILPVN